MTISYNWLLNYLPKNLSVTELSGILTSIGLEVEGTELVESVKGGLRGIFVGEVLSCEPHPNADKLKVTTVNVGGGRPLNIVCGAANVAAGQKVIVAVVGTTVHPSDGAPFEIKKAKIRGMESEGMICAEDEVSLGSSHEGIMVLPAEAVPGTPAAEYFGLTAPDTAIHIGLTPNRSDAMSHIGVARDVCAYLSHHEGTSYSVVMPDPETFANGSSGPVAISIEAPDACARYAGISIDGVNVAESPEWLKQSLATIGIRSINNIVDVTNYVLHEFGQPLHAFDADTISGNEIHVRRLPEGTKFVTLDEKERSLFAEDLMICDAQKPLCIAGVFGGNNSGVTSATKRIFLESAYFSGTSVRRTSLRHGLRTDAATHFEKCVDIRNVVPALQRAASLIIAVAGGSVNGGLQDIYPQPLIPVEVAATYNYIRTLSGKAYSNAAIRNILVSLQFEFISETEDGFTVRVPFSKNDVTQAADLVEEVLRIDGLDKIEIPARLNISLVKALPSDRPQREKIAEALCGMGFQEIITNSITNSRYYPGNETLVRMINSLNSELDVLRPSMLESGLEVLQYNINRKNSDLALFEFGNIYASEGTGKYQQSAVLAMWLSGNARAASWSQKAEAGNLFFLKSAIDQTGAFIGTR
ncbi:MAG: phenylalanine--tRNA ligase subunit beta [Chitinophagaceae bacterium]